MDDDTVTMAVLEGMSPDGRYIFNNLLPEWEEMFAKKQQDYGDDANKLGIKGAFVDFHRKEGKIKRAIWDDQELVGEQPREILMDVVGHCFLMIAELDRLEGRRE